MSSPNPPAYNNVLFVCAARMAGQAIIVASYSYNSDTDLSPVKQALEQPSMNLSPGKHYSFNVGQLAWHLIPGTIPWFQLSIVNHRVLRLFLRDTDDQGLIYVLVCAINYPQRCAHMCLEELQRTVHTFTPAIKSPFPDESDRIRIE
jgi:hypothetical protein